MEFMLITFVSGDRETTKNVLIASTYIPLKCNKFANYTSDLPSDCPRILLSDSDLYQEMLTKALAKHFGVKLLIVDSLLLPGGSIVKEVDLVKENSMSERETVLAKCAEHPAAMYCKNSVSGVEPDIPGGSPISSQVFPRQVLSPISSKTYTFKKGDRVKYRGGLKSGFSPRQTPLRGPNYGSKSKVVLAFEDNGASNVGVRFDRSIPDGNDLGGLCEDNHGFFCAGCCY